MSGVRRCSGDPKALFTRREGYPSKRVNPSWRAKDSPGLQAKFHRQGNPTTRDNLMRGYTQRVWKLFDLGHFSFNRNKTQTAVTNICLHCITL